MTLTQIEPGTERAEAQPLISERQGKQLATLADLLSSLEEDKHPSIAMLRSTCGVICKFVSCPLGEITLQMLDDRKHSFRAFLVGCKYKENSIRSYVNNLRTVLKVAEAKGWKRTNTVPEPWQDLLLRARHKRRIQLVRYLAKLKPSPRDISAPDVQAWVEIHVREGATMSKALDASRWFWKEIFDSRSGPAAARGIPRQVRYGVPLRNMPDTLKRNVSELLKWKQATFAVDRPQRGQLRAVSANHLQQLISRLYGYALTVRGERTISTLEHLIRKDIVTTFVEWSINERGVKGRSLEAQLGGLYAAIRYHPAYAAMDLKWFESLAASLPAESETEARQRKTLKYVEYPVLQAIPDRIRAERSRCGHDRKRVALLVMQELVIKWLTILPWRQRNLRECRITGEAPNLFKASISPFDDITKPEWVVREQEKNPNAEFWQFRFSAQETKTKMPIHALLPRQLVSLLEEYVNDHRPHLLRDSDPGTLLVGRTGRQPDLRQVTEIVSELTIRYAGKRVTPHRFRDIVAYTWLLEHPRDFLTLSKLLWHRNINTTINIYGSRFNESSGVVAMETWLEQREASAR